MLTHATHNVRMQMVRDAMRAINAAAGNRAALVAAYTQHIGHDPFAEDAEITEESVLAILRGFIHEWAASLGVGVAFLVDEDPTPRAYAAVAEQIKADACSAEWLSTAEPGDHGLVACNGGFLAVRCVWGPDHA